MSLPFSNSEVTFPPRFGPGRNGRGKHKSRGVIGNSLDKTGICAPTFKETQTEGKTRTMYQAEVLAIEMCTLKNLDRGLQSSQIAGQ